MFMGDMNFMQLSYNMMDVEYQVSCELMTHLREGQKFSNLSK